jgi:hypothetical protein
MSTSAQPSQSYLQLAAASAASYDCSCGRTFTQPSALKNHQNSCRTTKSRLSAALSKAKEVYAAEKSRKKLAVCATNSLSNPGPPVGNDHDSLSTMEKASPLISYCFHVLMIKIWAGCQHFEPFYGHCNGYGFGSNIICRGTTCETAQGTPRPSAGCKYGYA